MDINIKYRENCDLNGGGKWNLIEWFRAFFTSKGVSGYRTFLTEQTNLSKLELAKLKAIPFHAPNWLASILAEKIIRRKCAVQKYHNIIPTVAREAIAKALSAGIAGVAEIAINYQELGTGTTAPANGDTGLETPAGGTTRKVISSCAYSANKLEITCFWSAGEATGTWKEMATFINGTGTTNSGTLFNRIALDTTVGASNALTVDGEITIS